MMNIVIEFLDIWMELSAAGDPTYPLSTIVSCGFYVVAVSKYLEMWRDGDSRWERHTLRDRRIMYIFFKLFNIDNIVMS